MKLSVLILAVFVLQACASCEFDFVDACHNQKLMGPIPWNQYKGLGVLVGSEIVHYDQGVAFRVWAPHATSAQIQPKNNNNGRWSAQGMVKESNGTFYVNIPNASPGDAYVYRFQSVSGTLDRLDPRAQDIDPSATSNWQYSVVHDPTFDWGPAFTLPPSNQLVVYELHIPTFNVPSGSLYGSFDSAIEKLDFLQHLGVNAIELMPSAVFAGDVRTWGYNPCAPYATVPQWGGYKGLKRFVKAANSRNMGVLLDLVWNHADSGSNILNLYDGWSGTGSGSGIYYYEDGRANTPWGPRFNYDSPEVAQYILDSVDMWQQDYHISGFRWDATICIRKGGDGKVCWESNEVITTGWKLMQQANTKTTQYASSFSSAEDDQGYNGMTTPTNDPNSGFPGAPGGAGFTSQWGYTFYYAFLSQLAEQSNNEVDMGQVSSLVSLTNGQGGDPHRLLFTEQHDAASNQNRGRIPKIIDPNGSPYKSSYWAQKKAMLGLGVILSSPLFPMIFYGQELLSYASFDFPIPPPLDWGLAQANAGITQELADLIALRLNRAGNTVGLTGNATRVLQVVNQSTDKVLVMYRSTTGNSHGVVVVVNMYEVAYTNFVMLNIPVDGNWYIRFNGDLQKYSSLYENFGSSQTYVTVNKGQGTLMLPKYSIVILSQ